MKNQQNNQATPTTEELTNFENYRNSIIAERLAILNHSKLEFSEKADILKNAQEKYNNALMLTFHDYKAAAGNHELLTLNQPTMDDFFIKPSNADALELEDFVMYDECRDDLKTAIVFFSSRLFDLSIIDQVEASNHITMMSMLSRMIDKIEIQVKEDVTATVVMESDIKELLKIGYIYLAKLDDYTQRAGDIGEKIAAGDFENSFRLLEKQLSKIKNTNEVTDEERNDILSLMKYNEKVASVIFDKED